MKELVFTFISPFGGSGLGARGFLDAGFRMEGLGVDVRWECLGGLDIDPLACRDFEYLTGVPQVCSDVRALTPADLRRHYGERAPDCVLTSAPCQGSSAMVSARKAKAKKYQDLNELALIWTRLMLAAWDEPPALMLFENVPGLPKRAPEMLRDLRSLLERGGYVLHEGFHDCAEIGGMAQRRRRWLLVARRPRVCADWLRQPPKRRVRGCGEVLEQLPVPGTPAAKEWGPMHTLPRMSWLNWVRLSLIPADGDWRDLPDVLLGRPRREVFKRHRVETWGKPVGTVGGSGSNGVGAVADPRIAWFRGVLGVLPWSAPIGTITTESLPSNGRFSVADVRVKRAYDAGYGVLSWQQAARTIATKSAVGCGAYAVSDPRVADYPDDGGRVWDGDPKRPPNFLPVIVSEDGTWHRPLTMLELALLQGFPLRVNGRPLQLAGGATRIRRAIGNAIPAPAARAIGEKMLLALAQSALGSFSLSPDAVWVQPEAEACSC